MRHAPFHFKLTSLTNRFWFELYLDNDGSKTPTVITSNKIKVTPDEVAEYSLLLCALFVGCFVPNKLNSSEN
jgi:hypothetical protein